MGVAVHPLIEEQGQALGRSPKTSQGVDHLRKRVIEKAGSMEVARIGLVRDGQAAWAFGDSCPSHLPQRVRTRLVVATVGPRRCGARIERGKGVGGVEKHMIGAGCTLADGRKEVLGDGLEVIA
jgi:hypothetical protein